MPSLRKRVSSYFRQLSFYNEPREKKHNINENTFINKYLEGDITLKEGPQILYGKNPTDLPNYDLDTFSVGSNSIIGCYTGPNGGLTSVKRVEKHLSISDTDIDYIDTLDDAEVPVNDAPVLEKSTNLNKNKQTVDNTTMLIKVAGQEYLVTNRKSNDTKSHSLGSLSDLEIKIDKTKICSNNNSESVKCKNSSSDVQKNETKREGHEVSHKTSTLQRSSISSNNSSKRSTADKGTHGRKTEGSRRKSKSPDTRDSKTHGLSKSKSEGNPFQHKKKGKIIKIASRPMTHVDNGAQSSEMQGNSSSNVPDIWNKGSDHIYGISDSLYDRNQVTKVKNGDPIADCFGIVARNDSAILAVADGVNWGEKASVAAKSAIHGCLYYLNKTIFDDTKPFDELDSKKEKPSGPTITQARITNTREVFVCLLRAFNCAHDLILENEGMLTTLTVAVVLPLKPKNVKTGTRGSLNRRSISHRDKSLSKMATEEHTESYVCCVCNVGDTLAYVYSHKYGVRELTKGSHDINCNRDMRDALGALGPVDGINPELSNLTLSITVVQKGDIIMVASDGLTDNFDPNVCKFTVNSKDAMKVKPVGSVQSTSKAPVKPPRKSRPESMKMHESSSQTAKTSSDNNKATEEELNNPLVAQFMRENSLEEKEKISGKPSSQMGHSKAATPKTLPNQSSSRMHVHKTATRNIPIKRTQESNLLRSKTALDMRTSAKTILRNEDGIPFVTPLQRYEISLLLMEDILKRGISGHDLQCTTAKQVCENLVNFTFSISSAKRHTLEDNDLYFNNENGVLVEVSQQEKKIRRRRGLERVQSLPGKLDHVSIVAFNVGNYSNTF